ncbi:hypothetical protein KRE47_08140 [Elizabethkingia meningoseptica]|uniref:hypothetical protein n=1 Tax=Elizabethkingia meningoseptica TaxID=238 RepID=UPI0023B1FBA5|nr:hypothetical protein [Elizabethkingia meningoseptica]MDE5437591.1 hypothetical protein [Elizabethkingia meningoseptica]MDE5468003.1 hypothetical protein [Elizabethkingia meningoseptica]MDE5474922.1 hypothetical protein [Elizabethkingia meningoseptica]MDE5478355.1 hypothetical protein [Elizabethkingia meningoseptica]MDE5486754.1 hypothetical protein [Elizabethkingia meningoseptica]
MENLELQEKILNLGKLFVKELKLEPGVDTFSRWMAHYLAEKITIAEQSKGTKKKTAEKVCFDVILKLWEHRHTLPSGKRPFEGFEPILDTLSKLNPDREESYFYNSFRYQDKEESENYDSNSVKKWMNIAEEIDKTARVWIEYALSQASNIAKNEKTKEWIENAINLPKNVDAGIINILLDNNPNFNIENYDKDDFSKQYSIEKLNKRISQLENYSRLNETLLSQYKTDLEKLLND